MTGKIKFKLTKGEMIQFIGSRHQLRDVEKEGKRERKRERDRGGGVKKEVGGL